MTNEPGDTQEQPPPGEAQDLAEQEARKGWEIDVPEYYIDSYDLSASAYTITLHLGESRGPGKARSPLLRVRMSPQHAKAMSIMFHRAIQEVEKQFGGEFLLPPELIERKQLAPDND